MNTILDFVESCEVTAMQSLNLLFYTLQIGRCQVKIGLKRYHYMTNFFNFPRSLILLGVHDQKLTVLDDHNFFMGSTKVSVQVGHSLVTYNRFLRKVMVAQYKEAYNLDRMVVRLLDTLDRNVVYFSVTRTIKNQVALTGGLSLDEGDQPVSNASI